VKQRIWLVRGALVAAIVVITISLAEITQDREIVIPVVADQTGPIALYGKWAIDGMAMAVEDINVKQGINNRKLRLVIEDGQSAPQVGVSAFQRLLSLYHPGVIVVATNTGTVMACAPIANNKHIVLFTPISSGPNVTQAGDFVFRNRVSGYYEASEMARLAAERFGLKRVALAVLNNEAGPGYIEAFSDVFRSKGGTITERLLLDPGKTDYRTQVLKVRRSDSEAVFLALTVKEAATFIKQSQEIGFRPKWLSMTTIQSDELFKIAGKAAEGLVFVAEGGDEGNPEYRDLAARYKKRFGSLPAMNALNGYDAVHLLAPLIANNNADGKAIRDALYQTHNYRGVGGILSFDENGDAYKPLTLIVVKSGKFARLK
jgi:branched-chain amino acid transport system substrate-binding protein